MHRLYYTYMLRSICYVYMLRSITHICSLLFKMYILFSSESLEIDLPENILQPLAQTILNLNNKCKYLSLTNESCTFE